MDPQIAEDVQDAVYLSNVCEAFTCLPVAGGAVDQPVGLMKRIMLLRSYRRAVDLVNGDMPSGPDGPPTWAIVLIQQVQEARLVAVMERREREMAEAD
jgi:hypothetical protein